MIMFLNKLWCGSIKIAALVILAVLMAGCEAIFSDSSNDGCIKINGRTFSKTEFVDVISPNATATIPDGTKTTGIDDVFFEGRTVTLSHYMMCRYEVTQELYEYVMGKVPFKDEESRYGSESQKLRPAAGINWDEAVIFCNKLSELCGYEPVYTITNIKYANKGKETEYVYSATVAWDLSKNGFRLPTECEWEFAARGGGKSASDWNYKFSGGNNSKKVAWTNMNSSGYSDDDETLKTHQVGLKTPNACGIFDMSGNVNEWCMDWYRSVTETNDFSHGNRVNVESNLSSTDPVLMKGKYDSHVVRGGSYNESNGYSSMKQRLSKPHNAGYFYDESCANLGFRLVRRK